MQFEATLHKPLSIDSQDVLLTFIPSNPGGPCEEKLLKPNTERYREQHELSFVFGKTAMKMRCVCAALTCAQNAASNSFQKTPHAIEHINLFSGGWGMSSFNEKNGGQPNDAS